MIEIRRDMARERKAEALTGEARTLRLVIVDPHPLFRDCLASVLAAEPGLEVVGRVASPQEALDRLVQTRIDLLLVALDRGTDGGVGLIRRVSELSPASKVILLGHQEPEERVIDGLAAGASGYLVRGQSVAELRSALAVVARGEMACSPRLANLLFARLARLGRERRRRDRLDYLSLTPRELEILRLVAEGMNNQEIARQLFLSVHTVKNHIHKILDTLGVRSRWEAVLHAIERGWLRDRRRR
jgi:DNA-binding NarL/FixJ family response regulator